MEITNVEIPLRPDSQPRLDVILEHVLNPATGQSVNNIILNGNHSELRAEIEQLKNQIRENRETIKQQREELEKLETIKSRFFSVVSHDLKSPLCGLSGFINMILENVGELSKKEILQLIKQLKESIDGTVQLSDDLITWAQAQMKDFGVNAEVFDPLEIVENVFDVCQPGAQKKGIRLSHCIEDNIVLYGDKKQLTFIIRNLVSNAIKFTYTGGSVKVVIKENEFGDAEILIKDNGMGMKESKIHELFNPANHRSTLGTSGEKGTGMGLLLVKEFVDMHGGQIEVSSKEGSGSTFKITLNPLTLNQKILAI